MNKYLDIAPEVAEALAAGKPVVALESTIISHGMPYPQNVETALKVEQIIRDAGAVPATIAIIGGRLKAGLSKEEIDYLGRTGAGIPKASRRDLPVLVAQGKDGACTVTTTMMIADMAGIRVFATGGIGGVHRGAQETFDISADLEELANTSVMVVCAGAKSILDLGLTLEYLETHGVTVIGYGTSELPAFYTRKSGFGQSVPRQARAGSARRLTRHEPDSRRVLHGQGSHRQGHCRGRGGREEGRHPRQGHDALSARQDQGPDRRRQPGFQHPARVQQRAPRRGGGCGAQQARKVRYFVIYLAAINILTFCVYGADKRRAKIQGARRVPEKTLFALALLLGSAGALFAMRVFHHKTRHWYFKFGIPAILLAQIALGVFVYVRFFAA